MTIVDDRCANCGAPLRGEFCADCGQRARDFRANFLRVVGQFIGEMLEVDGRLWRSLGGLLWRPGSLAVAFSANRRADFVSPIRMYLFSSLWFFFVLSFTSNFEEELLDAATVTDQAAPGEVHVQFGADDTAPVVSEQGKGERAVEQTREPAQADPETLRPWLNDQQFERMQQLLANDRNPVAKEVLREMAELFQTDKQEHPLLQRLPAMTVEVMYDPSAFAERTLENLPLAMFFLLPMYALLLKILFFRNRRYYTEHLVFAIYLHVLAYLLFGVMLLFPDTPDSSISGRIQDVLSTLAFLALGIYTFRALRVYYERSFGATLWRFGLLGIGYTTLLLPALMAVFALSFFTL